MSLFIWGFVTAMLVDAVAFVLLRKKYAQVINILNERLG